MRGEAKSKIDAKGRMNFPAKICEDMGKEFVVAKALKARCIQVYTACQWEAFVLKITENNRKPDVEQLLRYRGAANATKDDQGRFFIPLHLREFAGLQNDVIVTGLEGTPEIWNKDEWDKNMGNIDIDSLVDSMVM
jgi:MraZ protein